MFVCYRVPCQTGEHAPGGNDRTKTKEDAGKVQTYDPRDLRKKNKTKQKSQQGSRGEGRIRQNMKGQNKRKDRKNSLTYKIASLSVLVLFMAHTHPLHVCCRPAGMYGEAGMCRLYAALSAQ